MGSETYHAAAHARDIDGTLFALVGTAAFLGLLYFLHRRDVNRRRGNAERFFGGPVEETWKDGQVTFTRARKEQDEQDGDRRLDHTATGQGNLARPAGRPGDHQRRDQRTGGDADRAGRPPFLTPKRRPGIRGLGTIAKLTNRLDETIVLEQGVRVAKHQHSELCSPLPTIMTILNLTPMSKQDRYGGKRKATK